MKKNIDWLGEYLVILIEGILLILFFIEGSPLVRSLIILGILFLACFLMFCKYKSKPL